MDRAGSYTVLVTGFGPFGDHQVNASWEAVKQLEILCANSTELADAKLVIAEIPVCYNTVSGLVPQLWAQHDPIVVLHVGVSRKADCLTIEYRAHNTGYQRLDINNKTPDETVIVPRVLQTDLDVKQLCDAVNDNWEKDGCKACISEDAGRYLCEYTFYHSLSIEPARALFVHVPDFHHYSSEKTAQGLFQILRCIVGSLRKDKE